MLQVEHAGAVVHTTGRHGVPRRHQTIEEAVHRVAVGGLREDRVLARHAHAAVLQHGQQEPRLARGDAERRQGLDPSLGSHRSISSARRGSVPRPPRRPPWLWPPSRALVPR